MSSSLPLRACSQRYARAALHSSPSVKAMSGGVQGRGEPSPSSAIWWAHSNGNATWQCADDVVWFHEGSKWTAEQEEREEHGSVDGEGQSKLVDDAE